MDDLSFPFDTHASATQSARLIKKTGHKDFMGFAEMSRFSGLPLPQLFIGDKTVTHLLNFLK